LEGGIKMKKYFRLIGGLVLLGLLSGTALGAGIMFNCNGTDNNNYVLGADGISKLAAGNAIQFIKGNKSAPNPSTNYLSGNNSLLGSLGQVGEGTDGEDGTFNRVESLATGTVYVRAWNQANPGEGASVKYGYSSYGYCSSGSSPPNPFSVPSFSLTYIANAPMAPTLKPVAEGNIGYDTAELEWDFAAGYEVTDVEVIYGTAKLDENNVDPSTGGVISVGGSPTSFKFPSYPNENSLAPNNTYYAQVVAKNYFSGTPGKSNVVSFSTIAVPVTEVGRAKKLSIKANQGNNTVTLNYEGTNATEFEIFRSIDQGKTWLKIADTNFLTYTDNEVLPDVPVAYYRVKAKNGVLAEATVARTIFQFTKLDVEGKKYTGINSFSIPFLPNGKAVDPADQWELTADGFEEYLRLKKGNIIEFIGGWNSATQKSFGRVYKEGGPFSGAESSEDFPLRLRKGYQIGVSESTEILIVGEVSGEKE